MKTWFVNGIYILYNCYSLCYTGLYTCGKDVSTCVLILISLPQDSFLAAQPQIYCWIDNRAHVLVQVLIILIMMPDCFGLHRFAG